MTTIIENKTVQLGSKTEGRGVQQLSWWQTALAFGIPALMMAISFHWVMPWLQSIGLTPFESIVVSHTVPMALLLTATLVMVFRLDGYPLTPQTFSKRLRYPRLTLKAVAQGLGLFVLMMVGYGLFNMLALLMIEKGWLWLPAGLPALLDPRVTMTTAVLDNMVGGQILGNWRVVILYTVMLVFNVVGEELWWRGYLLPRQEATNGRFAWVWNGLLWTVFHVFKWWDLIGLLPVCLALAYVSQRTKNNWPALIAHFLFNGLALVMVITAVVTVIG